MRPKIPPAAASAAIGKLQVKPTVGGVTIAFGAPGTAAPMVKIAPEAPARMGSSAWRFKAPLARVTATRTRPASGTGMADYRVSYARLEPGITCHYLITIPGSGAGPSVQRRGTFTTPPAPSR